ncbi:NimC/NimA family protein [Lachnospiraceae bacterium KM106-2]|nr:NimC/NimA family protein [Lachnospiraceae bacterium KM106-2]
MERVLEFLRKAGVFYLATVDGDQPHVRPIGFVMDCDGKLTFMSDNRKAVGKQLAANPLVEIACYDGAGSTLRICGKAVFVTSDETQKKALEVMPALGNTYAVGDGFFEIYYLSDAKAVLASASGEVEEITLA